MTGYIIFKVADDKPYVVEGNLGDHVTMYTEPITAEQFLDYVQYPQRYYVREVTVLFGERIEPKE
jgi:hypothetical protein